MLKPFGVYLGRPLRLLGLNFALFGIIAGQCLDLLGGPRGYLGPPWGPMLRVWTLGFGGWGLIVTTHASLKCKHRSRPTPVQRTRSPVEATWVKLGAVWDYGGAIFGPI